MNENKNYPNNTNDLSLVAGWGIMKWNPPDGPHDYANKIMELLTHLVDCTKYNFHDYDWICTVGLRGHSGTCSGDSGVCSIVFFCD
jgi:hypothetical protein